MSSSPLPQPQTPVDTKAPHAALRINETLSALPPSGIREFFELVIGMDDVVSLGVGEPDFVTPWNVCEHAIFTIEHGQTSYTSNKGILDLRREISKYMDQRFGVEYDPNEEVLVTVGVSQGLDLLMRAILNPGDEVIVAEPCYVAYVPSVVLAGGVPRLVSMRHENGFHLDLEEIEAAITPRTRAILLNYPSNPLGSTMTASECDRIAELAEEHDFLIVSDEIYAELTYDQEHVCMATRKGARERTVVLNGFSKAFAMTGWRIAYACGPAPVIAAMTKIFQYAMLSAPIMSHNAAVEALRTRENTVPPMIEVFEQRRRLFVDGLRAIGVECHMPEGAFYAFPSIEKFGVPAREFCKRLLQEEKVAVVPGSAFTETPAGAGHVRCAYAASFEDLETALGGFERLINRL